MTPHIVYAYAGDPQSLPGIAWLARKYGARVVTVTLDIGQAEPLDQVRDAARAAGAIRAHVLDVRQEFAREYVVPALHEAEAVEALPELMDNAAQRLAARKLSEMAAIEQTDVVAHASGDKSVADAISAVNPRLRVIAVPNPHGAGSGNSSPRPRLVAVPRYAETPAQLDIAFDRGTPVSVNGVVMDLVELGESLATIAAGHGLREPSRNTFGGAPATLLYIALRAVKGAVPTGEDITGVARLRLFNGSCSVVAGVAVLPVDEGLATHTV